MDERLEGMKGWSGGKAGVDERLEWRKGWSG